MAFESFARLPHVVAEVAIAAGIEGQPLPGGLKPRVGGGVRAVRRRIGSERVASDEESERR